MRIYLITVWGRNKRTGKEECIVSHGLTEDLRVVILPNEPLENFRGRIFSEGQGEWYIEE